jgi:hypothetical protein
VISFTIPSSFAIVIPTPYGKKVKNNSTVWQEWEAKGFA